MSDEPRVNQVARGSSPRDALGALLGERPAIVAIELLLVPTALTLRAVGVIRNPSLIILLVGWLSLWLRRSGWRAMGLRRPARPWRTILLGIGIAVAYNSLDVFAVLPMIQALTGHSINLGSLNALRGNLGALVLWVTLAWTFAAFVEELAYRGYVLNRLADLLGRSRSAFVSAAIIVSVLFGFAHGAQGLAGVLDNVLAGILFSTLYLASGRNLWLPVVVHGFVDTTSLVLLFLGYSPK